MCMEQLNTGEHINKDVRSEDSWHEQRMEKAQVKYCEVGIQRVHLIRT